MKVNKKILNHIKRKVNENRLRNKVSSILEKTLPGIVEHSKLKEEPGVDYGNAGAGRDFARNLKKTLNQADNISDEFDPTVDTSFVKVMGGAKEDMKELDVRKTHGDKRIENPATGNAIKLRTALKAKKGSAVYSKGKAMYNALKDEPTNERAYASTDGKPTFDYDPGQYKLTEMQMVNKKTGKDITKHVIAYLEKKITKQQFEKLTGLSKEKVKVSESMIGIKTKANFKPLQLKGALERAGIKGYQMNRLSVTLTALKLDKKYYNDAKKIIDDLGLSVMMAKEGKLTEGGMTPADERKIQTAKGFIYSGLANKHYKIVNIYPGKRRAEVTYSGPNGLEITGFSALSPSVKKHQGKMFIHYQKVN